jgi:hypothetical protein
LFSIPVKSNYAPLFALLASVAQAPGAEKIYDLGFRVPGNLARELEDLRRLLRSELAQTDAYLFDVHLHRLFVAKMEGKPKDRINPAPKRHTLVRLYPPEIRDRLVILTAGVNEERLFVPLFGPAQSLLVEKARELCIAGFEELATRRFKCEYASWEIEVRRGPGGELAYYRAHASQAGGD